METTVVKSNIYCEHFSVALVDVPQLVYKPHTFIMSTPQVNTEVSAKNTLDLALRQLDTSEALEIEAYLEQVTMKRLDALAEYQFWKAMHGMSDMPVQMWEYEVSNHLRVWV
jgi:hypothetical protein